MELNDAQVIGPGVNKTPHLLPRLIRFRDAPQYLGMDKNRFNDEVRPYITEIPIGSQGIAFDRLDLDAWVDQYKHRNGRPGQLLGERSWDVNVHPVSLKEVEYGISTNKYEEAAFAKALDRATYKKRRCI
jgi:hypothetical protein